MAKKKSAPAKLCDAVQKKQLDKVVEMIEAGYDLDGITSNGEGALHYAAATDPKIVKMLIDAGANIEMRDSNEFRTPISWSAKGGGVEAVEMLIQAGANVNATGGKTTPLGEAMEMLNQGQDYIKKLEKEKKIKSRIYSDTMEAISQYKIIIRKLKSAGALEEPVNEELEIVEQYKESELQTNAGLPQQQGERKIEACRGVLDIEGNYKELYVLDSVPGTVNALSIIRDCKAFQENISAKGMELDDNGCFVIRYKNHVWSQVIDKNWDHDYVSECKKISYELNTKSLYFSYSDTSGAFEYELYENGKCLERLCFFGDVKDFESDIRVIDQELVRKQRIGFVDSFFKKLNLLAASIDYSVLVPGKMKIGEKIDFTRLNWYKFDRMDYLSLK